MPLSGTPVACSVWWARPSAEPRLLAVLDATERQQAARLARDGDRARYVTAHALTRQVLARRVGEAPAVLRFDRTCGRCGADHGKPRLVGPGPAVPFSLAHTGERVVVAVASEAGHEVVAGSVQVGVDVEPVREPGDPVLSAAVEILAPAERAAYADLLPAARPHALAVWWTRKEAVLKATGDGLAVPPSELVVSLPDREPELIGWAGRAQPSVALCDLRPGNGQVGCVAVVGATSVHVTEADGAALLAGG
ncbi:MAG TPA: 4'-phosphopantetheinyl transferase superfamily protein [Jiangellales bacterium]|nr:4'-phosphopantetheinyl transferase superfamily protein [Jiangellales bacterium]